MKTVFLVIIILLAPISIWEYITGKIIDIAFTGILAYRKEVKKKFLLFILTKFLIWMFFLASIVMTYQMLFVVGSGDLRRVRGGLIVICLLIVYPFAMVRKWYASWVKETISGDNKNEPAA
jgi:nitric oxide reductase large subunit